MSDQEIVLSRDCEAVLIPSGTSVTLPSGTAVFITQSLGGTYTVAYAGGLARIDAKDADVLGITPTEASAPKEASAASGPADEKEVWGALKMVFDPEIPVNVVDLGLIYSLELKPLESGASRAEVKMTLTAPGCGMGPTIANDAKSRMLLVDGVAEAEVDLVWEPAWNQSMISEAGKMKLGMI